MPMCVHMYMIAGITKRICIFHLRLQGRRETARDVVQDDHMGSIRWLTSLVTIAWSKSLFVPICSGRQYVNWSGTSGNSDESLGSIWRLLRSEATSCSTVRINSRSHSMIYMDKKSNRKSCNRPDKLRSLMSPRQWCNSLYRHFKGDVGQHQLFWLLAMSVWRATQSSRKRKRYVRRNPGTWLAIPVKNPPIGWTAKLAQGTTLREVTLKRWLHIPDAYL